MVDSGDLFTGAVVLAVLGGTFCLLGSAVLTFVPRTLQGRTAIGGSLLGLGLVLLLVLLIELNGLSG